MLIFADNFAAGQNVPVHRLYHLLLRGPGRQIQSCIQSIYIEDVTAWGMPRRTRSGVADFVKAVQPLTRAVR